MGRLRGGTGTLMRTRERKSKRLVIKRDFSLSVKGYVQKNGVL
jgi:hypothetical protein